MKFKTLASCIVSIFCLVFCLTGIARAQVDTQATDSVINGERAAQPERLAKFYEMYRSDGFTDAVTRLGLSQEKLKVLTDPFADVGHESVFLNNFVSSCLIFKDVRPNSDTVFDALYSPSHDAGLLLEFSKSDNKLVDAVPFTGHALEMLFDKVEEPARWVKKTGDELEQKKVYRPNDHFLETWNFTRKLLAIGGISDRVYNEISTNREQYSLVIFGRIIFPKLVFKQDLGKGENIQRAYDGIQSIIKPGSKDILSQNLPMSLRKGASVEDWFEYFKKLNGLRPGAITLFASNEDIDNLEVISYEVFFQVPRNPYDILMVSFSPMSDSIVNITPISLSVD